MEKTTKQFFLPEDILLKKVLGWFTAYYVLEILFTLFFSLGGTAWLIQLGMNIGLSNQLLLTLARIGSLLLRLSIFLVGAGLLATHTDWFIKHAGRWLIAAALTGFILQVGVWPLFTTFFTTHGGQSLQGYLSLLLILTTICYFPYIQALGVFLKKPGDGMKNLGSRLLGIAWLSTALLYLYHQTTFLLYIRMREALEGAEQAKTMLLGGNTLFAVLGILIPLFFLFCWCLLLTALSAVPLKRPDSVAVNRVSGIRLEKVVFFIVLFLFYLGMLFVFYRLYRF